MDGILKEGYLLCVFGDDNKYYKLALRLIDNLRLYDNTRPICVLTDKIGRYTWSDDIMIRYFDINHHIHSNISVHNSWNKYGLYPKIFQSLYTPFVHTMFMDVDMIFYADFTFIWDRYYESNQPILVPGKSDENNRSPPEWHWGKIDKVMDKIGFVLPQTFTTLVVYNKGFSNIIKICIASIFDHLSDWEVQSIFRDGYPDEIMYSILLGMNQWRINQWVHDWLIDGRNCDAWNKKTTPEIGAYYHVYKNPMATYKCLESFRKFYPNNSIVLVSDNGYDYTEMARHFNCTYVHCEEQLWLIYEDKEDLKRGIHGQQIHWVNKLLHRLYHGFALVKEDYFIWLEDDIVINKPVDDPLLCDINGYNPNSYSKSMLSKLNKSYPNIDINRNYTWAGGGGSIFNKHNIRKYMENQDMIYDIVNNWIEYGLHDLIICDFLLSTLTHLHNGRVGPCNEIADGYSFYEISPNLAVQHQYKKYYGVDLSSELQHLVIMK